MIKLCRHFFYLVCQSDQINLCPPAGGTRYHLNPAGPKPQSLKDPLCGTNLLHRITGQGYPDRIPDALMEDQSQTDR